MHSLRRRPLVLGLAGKAGSGFDSDVVSVLETHHGFKIVRADDAIDAAWEVPHVRETIGDLFGREVVFENSSDPDPRKWTRNRGVLGTIVAADPSLKARLNGLLYSQALADIFNRLRRFIESGDHRIAITAPRLVNADLKLYCHFTWYVDRTENRRREALLAAYRERGFDPEYVESKVDNVMRMQGDVIDPAGFSYDVVLNHPEDWEELRARIDRHLAELLRLHAGERSHGRNVRYLQVGTRRGQFVRSALSLSQLTLEPLELVGANLFDDGGPRLKRPIEACARACVEVCTGRFRPVPDQRLLEFEPGSGPPKGRLTFETRNTESISTLVVTLLPLYLRHREPVEITLRGGTELECSSPMDYYRNVFFPILRRLGVQLELTIDERGFFGGPPGCVRIAVQGTEDLAPIVLTERGRAERIVLSINTCGSGVPGEDELGESLTQFFRSQEFDGVVELVTSRTDSFNRRSISMSVALQTTHAILGADSVCDQVNSSEDVERAVEKLKERTRFLFKSPAAVDPFTADKILLYLALSGGSVTIPITEDMEHVYTQLNLLSCFHEGRIEIAHGKDCYRVKMDPMRTGSRHARQ